MLNGDNTTTSRRSSCDRCHGQKLRCSRRDRSRIGPCDRCLRQGVVCVYSSSLPKGRPSLYRLSEQSQDAKDPKEPKEPSSISSVTPYGTSAPTKTRDPGEPSPVRAAAQLGADTMQTRQATARGDNDPDTIPMEVDCSDSVGLADIDAFAVPEPLGVRAGSHGLWRWATYEKPDNSTDWALNWDPAMESHLRADSGYGSTFESDPSWATIDNHGNSIQAHATSHGDSIAQLESEPAESSTTIPGYLCVLDKSRFELGITHLSRLSMRLSQLVLSKGFLLATTPDPNTSKQHQKTKRDELTHEVRAVVKAVFTSINSWVISGNTKTNECPDLDAAENYKTATNILPQVFASSNYLLDILRCLRESPVPTTQDPSATSSSPPTSHASSNSALFESPSTGADSGAAVHHLVLACASQLLNIYAAILDSIIHTVEILDSVGSTRKQVEPSGLVEPSYEMELATRSHLQQVSLVQLCSYFIKSLKQILGEMFLSQESRSAHPSSDEASTRAIETMNTLQAEVEQCLKRVQEKLHIVS